MGTDVELGICRVADGEMATAKMLANLDSASYIHL